MRQVTFSPVEESTDWIARADEIGQEEGLPPGLMSNVVKQESGGNPSAVSKKGAIGLTQLMPGTAREMGVNPNNPEDNLRGGARYLKMMLDKYKDTGVALAAYNAGPGAVDKHGGIPPYTETREYVKKVQGNRQGREVTFEPVEVTFEEVQENKSTPSIPERPLLERGATAVADVLLGTGETAANIATGALAYPIAKVGGAIAQAVKGGKSGQETEDYLANLFTYKPQTESGKAAAGIVGKVAGLPFKPAEYVGEYVEKKLGPEAGYAAKTAGEYATMLSMPGVARKGKQGIVKGQDILSERRQANLDNKITQAVDQGIAKGIRPGVEGQRTAAQSKVYNTRARNAVETIIENKDSITFVDEFGEATTGKLPQNLYQFREAIGQTKNKIYADYDAMKTAAGEQGAVVDLSPIVKELKVVSQNKVLNDLSPETANYAQKRLEALETRGAYTAAEAQEALVHLNESLKSFYRNPTPDTVSRVFVDKMVADNIRKGLDSTIEKAEGPGYQELKNKYGSLKAIERDVNRRAIVDARKNSKGLTDLIGDVFSGAEVIRGVISANPSAIGAGVSAKLISALHKYWNNPNVKIKKMFENTEKLMSRRAKGKRRK